MVFKRQCQQKFNFIPFDLSIGGGGLDGAARLLYTFNLAVTGAKSNGFNNARLELVTSMRRLV